MGRLFGTNGVRGTVNEGMDAELALRLGRSLATHVGPGCRVALGTDARTSSPLLASALEAGLLSGGVDVVRLGVAPSPGIQYYVKVHAEVAAGAIVTASHNPPQFNGIKLVAGDGTEMSAAEEARVEDVYFSQDFRDAAWDSVGRVETDVHANDAYTRAVVSKVNADRIRARKLTVAIDTAGGPGGLVSPLILRDLGCAVVEVNVELDGRFRGRPSEPVAKNLGALAEAVRTHGADLGVAHDGDADRCIFLDETGRWIAGDQSFALLAQRIVGRAGGGVVCTPVSSSSLISEVVRASGGHILTTAVGSPVVARSMLENEAVFGGEENGGLIFPAMQHCRDAAMTMAAMLELLADQEHPLGYLADRLPQYHVHKTQLPCPNEQKAPLLRALDARLRSVDDARLDATDGLKIYYPDGDWVLIRPSGTEPIYRVFAESKDADRAMDRAERFVKMAQELLRPT